MGNSAEVLGLAGSALPLKPCTAGAGVSPWEHEVKGSLMLEQAAYEGAAQRCLALLALHSPSSYAQQGRECHCESFKRKRKLEKDLSA